MTGLGTLGRYTLLRRLAAGGMGEVYLAEAQGAANFSRRVAIKRILPHLARDEDFVRKFIDEANIMVQLHHGNIVGVQELADHDGELYIVMEYLPGRDLKAVTRRMRRDGQRMPPDLALWLVTEICAALDYAHRKPGPDGEPLHIVHRDVSPSNVVLGAGGEVKLLDFGIARARGRLHQSVSGTLQGKFVYMSPEQADGRAVDARSDVFSVGLVLYELLTGVRPFEGESETETLRKVRMGQVAPPSTVAELPPALDALVMSALALEPAQRYESASEMRRRILHYLADTRSTVDARSLADFLREIFPEGVVPSDAPDAPMSLDDALQLQLGALTPNVDPMTRTATAEEGVASARRFAVTPTPSSRPEISVTGPALAPAPQPVGLKRSLVLGVVLGALVATGVGLWVSRRSHATIEATVEGPTDWELFVDRLPTAPRARLPVDTPLEICVRAAGYTDHCRRGWVLRDGVNRLRFRLAPAPTWEPIVFPPRMAAAVGFETEAGMALGRELEVDKTYKICLREVPVGYAAEQKCAETFKAVAGETHRPRFRLLPLVVDAGPPSAAAPDAAPATPGTAAPARPASKAPAWRPKITTLSLRSEPSASVHCAGGPSGKTPMEIVARRAAMTCTLSAPGFSPATVRVEPGQGARRKTITLQRPARVSVRALPGAAWIHIDGRRIGQGSVASYELPPGPHRVEARIERDGKTYTRSVNQTLVSGENSPIIITIADVPGGRK